MFIASRRICIFLMRLVHHLKKYFIHSTNNYWVPGTCITLHKVLACINEKALPMGHLLSKINFTKLKFNIFYLLLIACIYPNYIIRCNHPENKRETEFYFNVTSVFSVMISPTHSHFFKNRSHFCFLVLCSFFFF